MALIQDDPERFGLDGNLLTPTTAEFKAADKILELARALHDYLKETAQAEAVLIETYGALVRAVAKYWGDVEGWGLDCPVEEKSEPATEAKPKKIGIPFAKKVGR